VVVIALDTNVVVRFLTRDDEAQFKRATRVFSSEEILLTETVFLESEWVLRHAYGFTVTQITEAFNKLIGLPNVYLSDASRILTAIAWSEQGLDFADALHLAGSQTAESFITFDKRLVTRSTGLGTCAVKEPS
jgi:predicted nucleic-acid-binding protein